MSALTSAASKALLAGAGAALTLTSLRDDRAWISHPSLANLPSLTSIAEAAAQAMARRAAARDGQVQGANGTGTAVFPKSFEEELEYFLMPDMVGWRF